MKVSAAYRPFSGPWQELVQAERDKRGIVPGDQYLNVREAAAAVGVSYDQMRRLVRTQKVPATKEHSNSRFFGYKIRKSVVFNLKPKILKGEL